VLVVAAPLLVMHASADTCCAAIAFAVESAAGAIVGTAVIGGGAVILVSVGGAADM
jgi:hypothetical protein